MKIKEISKKVISSFLVLAIMILPTIVFAREFTFEDPINVTEEAKNEVKEEEKKEEVKEEEKKEEVKKEEKKEEVKEEEKEYKDGFEDNFDESQEEKYLEDAKQIKLLDKIKFSGDLYKTFSCKDRKGTYSEQVAVVTEITHRKDGILGVTFTQKNKILSTFGYIKVNESKVLAEGKLLSLNLDFKITGKEVGNIKINEKEYTIAKNSVVELVNGGIKIDDEFIALKENDEVKLMGIEGNFNLENSTNKMIDRFEIKGDTTFKIIKNGFIVTGKAVVNGEEVSGEVEVTYEGEKVNLKLLGAEINGDTVKVEDKTKNFKTLIGNIISKIIEFFKNIFSKVTDLLKI